MPVSLTVEEIAYTDSDEGWFWSSWLLREKRSVAVRLLKMFMVCAASFDLLPLPNYVLAGVLPTQLLDANLQRPSKVPKSVVELEQNYTLSLATKSVSTFNPSGVEGCKV